MSKLTGLMKVILLGLCDRIDSGRVGGRPRVITDRGKVKELRAAGKSLPTIAREIGLSITTIARICKDAE